MPVAARARRPSAPGFLRMRCERCHAEKLVAFSCKQRGFCPSCRARRMVEAAALLADEVLPQQPLRQWVLSLPYALRFLLAKNPAALTLVLDVAYRVISGHLLKKAGLTRARGDTGAVTLVQRFGSSLNLNIHLHMIFLDGAYEADEGGTPLFRQVPAPTAPELELLVRKIAERTGRLLAVAPGDDADHQQGHLGNAARAAGFSLHAGVDVAPGERAKLEHLCRYVSRPPVAEERMALISSGQIRYTLKTPYRNGTTHIVVGPLDLMARLAALVPPPRMHLTRYHGVFAPHSKLRAAVTPAHRGMGAPKALSGDVEPQAPMPRHVAMNWARRLKRVFGIEIESCAGCGGPLRIIASIEEPQIIAKILSHLASTFPDQYGVPLGARAPPGIQRRLL